MTDIKKLLSADSIEPRYISSNSVWIDLAEDIHFHYRNLRLDFSQKEWAEFRAAINNLGKVSDKTIQEYDYEEGDPNFLVELKYNFGLADSNSDYYPNRTILELQRDNTVHLHYRNVRLRWTVTEFVQIARMFVDALSQYQNLKPFAYSHIKESIRVKLDIDLVQPYDAGHFPLIIDDEHRAGIEYVKNLIREGKKIRPILIACNGQRLDGFKRYMAFKELGHKEIECIVDPFGRMGGQQNQSMIDDD